MKKLIFSIFLTCAFIFGISFSAVSVQAARNASEYTYTFDGEYANSTWSTYYSYSYCVAYYTNTGSLRYYVIDVYSNNASLPDDLVFNIELPSTSTSFAFSYAGGGVEFSYSNSGYTFSKYYSSASSMSNFSDYHDYFKSFGAHGVLTMRGTPYYFSLFNSSLSNIKSYVSSIKTYTEQVSAYTDGIETYLNQIIGYVNNVETYIDTVESLIATLTGNVSTVINKLTYTNQYIDGLEGYVDNVESLLSTLINKTTYTNQYIDGLEGYVDNVESLLSTNNNFLSSINSSVSNNDTYLVSIQNYLKNGFGFNSDGSLSGPSLVSALSGLLSYNSNSLSKVSDIYSLLENFSFSATLDNSIVEGYLKTFFNFSDSGSLNGMNFSAFSNSSMSLLGNIYGKLNALYTLISGQTQEITIEDPSFTFDDSRIVDAIESFHSKFNAFFFYTVLSDLFDDDDEEESNNNISNVIAWVTSSLASVAIFDLFANFDSSGVSYAGSMIESFWGGMPFILQILVLLPMTMFVFNLLFRKGGFSH